MNVGERERCEVYGLGGFEMHTGLVGVAGLGRAVQGLGCSRDQQSKGFVGVRPEVVADAGIAVL